jgi:RHS repeat-associated protein
VTLTYDVNLRLVAVTDAIGQVTTLSYELTNDTYKVTKVTDPFGRFATFNYGQIPIDWHFTILDNCPVPSVVATPTLATWLQGITDVIGLSSQFSYYSNSVSACAECSTNHVVSCVTKSVFADSIVSLTTPYGTTQFDGQDSGNTRYLKATYPDGSSEIVEYTQTNNIPQSDPPATVPTGMKSLNDFLPYRNTYYFDRIAAPSYPDFSKARLFHWLHAENGTTTSGALESTKQPLENRVWYDYTGQADSAVGSVYITSNTLPAHVGRVLDDGSTQLYTYGYNPSGHITNAIDPVGRTFSFVYDTNGIDLLEVRQTRARNNELLAKFTYNSQHCVLTQTDAAGQTFTYTYNTRGQLVARSNPRHEKTTYAYDANGYLLEVDGPQPGTNDVTSATYDALGRVRTLTGVSGYTLRFDYDDMDRLTRIAFPDGTSSQFTYDRLDLSKFQDRAGRATFYEHDNMRQLIQQTDPLGRVTHFEWCRCGDIKSLIDPMGRTTAWLSDVQGRRIAKQYSDGSKTQYVYENTTSRLRQVIDERQQSIFYAHNSDDTLRAVTYANAKVPTPPVSFTYDPDYERVASMRDGVGTSIYTYYPITGAPALGAGRLAAVDGPLSNDTANYIYDETGRLVGGSLGGVAWTKTFDPEDRVVSESNVLGSFSYTYDGASSRLLTATFPNNQTEIMGYNGIPGDETLQQISYAVGAAPVSRFLYGRDVQRRRITTWSQQAGTQPSSVFTFAYDLADQLISAAVTNSGVSVNAFQYSYDAAGNRLTELAAGSATACTYNALNQLSTSGNAAANSRTNEWDAQNRLTAVNQGNQRTEFAYDGGGRLAYIRQLQDGAETSFRRLVWCGGRICEERDTSGAHVTKRFYSRGVRLETGPNAGTYYYTRDHLGSIRELIDTNGNVRARYAYDPYGRRTKVSGDVDADFGHAGMFWASEAALAVTRFRTYDPQLGRWLSRDPLGDAERKQGPNLYAYVRNEPINQVDRSGLMCNNTVDCTCLRQPCTCAMAGLRAAAAPIAGVAAAANQAGNNVVNFVQSCGQNAWQTLSTEITADDFPDQLQSIAVRAQDLANRFNTTVTPADFELVEEANIQTQELYDVETEFYELATDMATEEGISLEDAWQKLAELVRFDPNQWPQLRAIENLTHLDPRDLNPELYPPF